MLLGDDYYRALQQDNVELVTDPIDRITETSVVTRTGQACVVDAIVLATGFETSHYLSGIDVIGTGGQHLHERWGLDPSAYLGTAVSGFPNFFMLYGPNTNQGSLIPMIEYEAQYAVKTIAAMDAAGVDWVDVKRDVMDAYNAELQAGIDGVEVWKGGCSHYYLSESGRMVTQYPWSMYRFRDAVSQPDLDDFELGTR